MLLKGLDQIATDSPAMDFVGPIDETLASDICVPASERCVLAEAQRSMELNRRVDNLVDHVREEHLRNRVFLPKVHLILGLPSDVKEHQAGDVELGCAVSEHPLNSLAFGKRLAEGYALGHTLSGHVQSALRHSDVVHPVTEPPVGEPMLTHIEPLTFAAKQVRMGHD